MADAITPLVPLTNFDAVPPPRRGRAAVRLDLHAVQVLTMLGLLPLATIIIGLTVLSQRRLARQTRRPGAPRVYADSSILLLALLGRLWHLSTRQVCTWLVRWPALAAACGLPPGRVIHHAHLSRRVRQLGPYPFWLL